MKNKLLISILFFVTVLFAGCYEDKGNYDYENINKVKIDFNLSGTFITTNIGKTITINPIYTFSDATKKESDFDYIWTVNGETREGWNTPDFEWKVDEKYEGVYITLEMRDRETDISFFKNVYVMTNGEYNLGYAWMILSEKNGESVISIFNIKKTSYSDDYLYEFIDEAEILQDVYKNANGSSAGTGPIKLVEHYRKANIYVGSFLLIQDSSPIDIDGESMLKDIDYATAFDGGIIPEKIVDAVFKVNTDVLVGESGKLYSRLRTSNTLFNSGRFLSIPIKYNNEILEKCELIFSPALTWGTSYTLIKDNNKKRMLVISDYDGSLYEYQANPTGIPADFAPLNDLSGYEILKMASLRNNYFEGEHCMVYQRNGTYFWQRFSTSFGDNNTCTPSYASVFEIKGLPGKPTSVYIEHRHKFQPYVFFAIGKQIYMFDTSNPEFGATHYLELDSEVISMDGSYYGSHVFVTLENGKFIIMNMAEAKNCPDDLKILYTSPEGLDLGRIVQVCRKYQKMDFI